MQSRPQRPRAPPFQRHTPYGGLRSSLPAGSSTSSSGHQTVPSPPTHPLQPLLLQVLQEVRSLAGKITRLQDNQAQLTQKIDRIAKALEDQARASFCIDKANFQDQLNREISRAFCRNIRREANREELKTIICNALKEDAKIKYKFEQAKKYILHRFVELRSEERRRLFALKPCESFGGMSSEEFAEKFCATLKAGEEHIPHYTKNLAAMRKFQRVTPTADALANTHQKFRKWLDTTFCDGVPSEEEWQTIMEEDKEAMYTTGAAGCKVGEVLEEGLVHEQLYSDLEVQLEGETDQGGEH